MKASGFYNIRTFTTLCAILILASAVSIQAQESTATLSGQVKDTDGLPRPGVNITASSGATAHNAYTDAAGKFALRLTPGKYDITAELSGFVTITQTDIEVNAGDNNITFEMKTGGLTELMVVTASKVETPLINAPATM